MSNLHKSNFVSIPQPPEDYRPQHPALHFEQTEGLITDTIRLAKWIRNKTSDRGDRAAKLIIKYKELKDKEQQIEEGPETTSWFGKSKEKKLKETRKKRHKIGDKLRNVYMEVMRNKRLYEKNEDDGQHYELFYQDLRNELLQEGVEEDEVDVLIDLFKDVVT